MTRFIIGNVVKNKKLKNDLYVISEENDLHYTLISFDASNVTCNANNNKTFRKDMCGCFVHQRCPNPDCEDCKGTGYIKVQNNWIGDYKYVADNIKEYIIDGLSKPFDL